MNKPNLKLAAAWAATNIADGIKQQCIWICEGDWLKKLITLLALIINIVLLVIIRFCCQTYQTYVELKDINPSCHDQAWGHIKRFWSGGRF